MTPPKPRDTLADIAARGDTTSTLEALRDHIAATLDTTTSARETASLSRQLVHVLTELDGRKPAPRQPTSPLDQLAQRTQDATGPRIASRRQPGDNRPAHLS